MSIWLFCSALKPYVINMRACCIETFIDIFRQCNGSDSTEVRQHCVGLYMLNVQG